MTTDTVHETTTSAEIGGVGHSVRRTEDERFIQGAGHYVDDIVLPGMLHVALLRSPVPHARIVSIDTAAAAAVDGVVAVLTGRDLEAYKLAWMPTLSGDTQAVLATDKVRFQGQEVAAVIAESPYAAYDALDMIDVEYDMLPPVLTPQQSLAEGAPLIRDDKDGQTDNACYTWESGDEEATNRAFDAADVVVWLDTHYPRSHPSPLETCACVADVDPATKHVTVYMTSQAPHAHRTLFAMVTGLPEQHIRIISPDIGGGFGNKVPIYPGYVVATAASLVIGKPVKWVETRTENLISTGFARDYHMHGELALTSEGKILGLRVNMLSDNGAFFADAQPTGFMYDSGDYPAALQKALDIIGYDGLRAEQAAARQRGDTTQVGIGIASFTEVVGAGKGTEYDIAGLRMFDSAELRVHPTGKAILKLGVRSQGQGHETTFAQIVANELGIPVGDVKVMEGDTDNTPYGLGTYASRSTPVGGAATAVISRKLREKATKIAAHLLEAAEDDMAWEAGRFYAKGSPPQAGPIQDVPLAAYPNLPDGMEAGLEGGHYYDPPNMTYPFGSYVVVVDVDSDTGQWTVRRMVAVDDCGVRINPMIVDGQIHGGLAEGYAMSSMQFISFDEDGNCIGSNFMDYLIPTAWETPRFELDATVTPSPHHPIGAKGVGESATVGSPAAYVNAVIDALSHLGVTNIDMPVTSAKVWTALQETEQR